jgi:hypothetical protein
MAAFIVQLDDALDILNTGRPDSAVARFTA